MGLYGLSYPRFALALAFMVLAFFFEVHALEQSLGAWLSDLRNPFDPTLVPTVPSWPFYAMAATIFVPLLPGPRRELDPSAIFAPLRVFIIINLTAMALTGVLDVFAQLSMLPPGGFTITLAASGFFFAHLNLWLGFVILDFFDGQGER